MTAAKKVARLAFRVRPELKSRIEEAAELREVTVSEFCLAAIREKVSTVLPDQSIRLRGEAAAVFFEALVNPPEPNEALRAAARAHGEQVVSD